MQLTKKYRKQPWAAFFLAENEILNEPRRSRKYGAACPGNTI